MLYRRVMILPAAALALTVGTTGPSLAQCDTAAVSEIVKSCNISGDVGPGTYVQIVECQLDNACAVSRRDIAMVRGGLSDAYGALSGDDAKKALATAKALGEGATKSCEDKSADALLALDQCSMDEVLEAAKGM